MNANHHEETVPTGPHTGRNNVPHGTDAGGTPITRQLRTVGQRRRDAEFKLQQHLQQARRKITPHDDTSGSISPA